MMNSGKCIDINEIMRNKESWADKFCEENLTLKILLLYSWNNNLTTYASCIGHPDDIPSSNNKAFIIYEYNGDSLKKLTHLINTCLEKVGIMISITKGSSFENRLSISTTSIRADDFFQFIYDTLIKEKEESNELYLMIDNCLTNYGSKDDGFTIFIQKNNHQKYDAEFLAYTEAGTFHEIQDKLHDFLIAHNYQSDYELTEKYWPLKAEHKSLSDINNLMIKINDMLISEKTN